MKEESITLKLKLYIVEVNGCGKYRRSYVVAETPNDAYKKVRQVLDSKGYGFSSDRGLHSITVVADTSEYSDVDAKLFL